MKPCRYLISARLVMLTSSPNPDNSVNHRMSSIVSASIHRMRVVDTSANRKLLDYSNTHTVGLVFGPMAVSS